MRTDDWDLEDEVVTFNQSYAPLSDIETQGEANEYFEKLVLRKMKRYNRSREEAIAMEKENIGYWTGYLSRKTAARILEFFETQHPIFGKDVDVPPEEAFAAGLRLGMMAETAKEKKHVE